MHLLSSSFLVAALPALAIPQEGSSTPGHEEAKATDEGEPAGILPIPDFSGGFWDRAYLTGDWNGARAALAEDAGIQLDVKWTQYVQSVLDGGIDRESEYGGRVSTRLRLDLMRMGVLPGALIDIRALSRYGEFTFSDSGQALPVNTDAIIPQTLPLYDDYGIAITHLNYVQFFSEHIAAFLGKIDTFDGDQNEFASGRGATQFMNYNFVFAAPTAIVPGSTLGGGLIFLPNEQVVISTMLLNAEVTSSTVGFDDLNGLIFVSENRFQYRLGDLPGGLNANYLYFFHTDFTELGGKISIDGEIDPEGEDESWMAFFSGWQYVYAEEGAPEGHIDVTNGEADLEGVGLFGRVAWADEDTNPWKFNISGGIGGRGIIPNRDDDTFGVAYYWSDLDPDRYVLLDELDDSEDGLEVFYKIALTPAAKLSLDLQVLDSPLPGVDTAYLFATRLEVNF